MSESSRKRSRKSKLVPRECTEVEDENVENLQVTPANNKNKVKTSTKKDTAKGKVQSEPNSKAIKTTHDDFEALIDSQKKEETQPKREFSITVAVEECDENSTELMIVETKQEPEIVLSDDENNELKNEWYTLDRETILNATSQLQKSNNPADKLLVIEVRNGLGRFPTNVEDPEENKIQNVLNQWLDTQKLLTAKQKSPPLFYKCYICEKSWWYLHPFREHLKDHDDYFLHLETSTLYEFSVIATPNARNIEIKYFETQGNCPKCGYDFEIHKNSLNNRETAYICKIENCNKALPTCFMLRQHEYTYHTLSQITGTVYSFYSNEAWKKYCEICGPMFNTQQSYNEHMDLMHSVRSDVVIPWKEHSTCQSCRMKCVYGWHDCMKKRVANRCDICKISLSNFMFPIHNKQNGYTCSICNIVLPKHCMDTRHLMEHTNNFVLMQKCALCMDFVVIVDNKDSRMNHCKLNHKLNIKEKGITKYLRTILIPKACLTGKPIPTVGLQLQIKEEPTDIQTIQIKQEVIDNSDNSDNEDAAIKIEDEIDLYDNFEASMRAKYNIKLEAPNEHSRVFGIKIEACEIEPKQEISEEEYVDDIIKLDQNFLNAIKESEEMQDRQESVDDMPDSSRKPKLYRCTKCGYYGYHKEYRLHLKTDCQEKVYDKGNYTCTKCFTTYDLFQQYIEHLSKHNLNALRCPECFREFSSYQVLLPHISMHIRMTYVTVPIITECKKNAQFIYQCKICRDKVDKSDFFQHWEEHLTFSEDKNKKVDTDNNETKDCISGAKVVDQHLIQELLQHLQSPDLTYMKRGCLICHRHFVRKNDCKRHLIEHLLSDAYAHRPQSNAFICQICQKTFQKSDKYKKHMRDHASLPEYRCDLCDKSFSDSSNFTKHKKLHNLNAYTCDTCGKKFQAKISLEKHMELHLNQFPIECAPCKKTFYLSSAYKKHFRMQHEKHTLRFSCIVCSVKFKCLKDKWDHMWYVHKERKHKADCTKCNMSYRRFRDLKTHMKTDHHMDLKFCKLIKKKVIHVPHLKNVNIITPKSNPSQTKPTESRFVFDRKVIPLQQDDVETNLVTSEDNSLQTMSLEEPAETLVVFE